MLVVLTGVVAGAIHVLAGPDHLAVLAPFSVEAGRRAWRVGLRWGIGHVAGLVGVAGLAWLLRDRFDPAILHATSAPLIGFVLVAVGVWGLLHARRPHPEAGETAQASEPHVHTTAALCVGALHGVVGTGGVLTVVPVLGMANGFEAGGYLLGFGAGTLAAMVAVSVLLGRVASLGQGAAYRRIFVAASGVALAVGIVWLVLHAQHLIPRAAPG